MNNSNSPDNPNGGMDKEKEVIKEEDIGKVRHDEPVTAKGIARALLMANEPEQRMKVIDSENEADPKADD